MDVIVAIKNYLEKIIKDSGTGMKALLMDKETTVIVSLVFAKSEMLQREVYLFERLDSEVSGGAMSYVKCVVLVRPSRRNIDLLVGELRRPRYGSYYINFSQVVPKSDVKLLAEADVHEVVADVHEVYADYCSVAPHLFHLNIPNCMHGLSWRPDSLQRSVHGLTALMLSLNICPLIRYQASSHMARILAENVRQAITTDSSLFNFRRQDPAPVLLIVDRRQDAVTPLLNQWTYQAMLHELLTITNNRVDLSQVPNVADDLREVVMSPEHDEFYAKNMYMNFGEIGQTIKELMDDYQRRLQCQKKVECISDMKQFVDMYPQFKKMSGTVAKHVTVVSELSRLVGRHCVLQVSEAEQQMVCNDQHQQSLQMVYRLVKSKEVRDIDAVRLVMLYALRYETHSNNDINKLTMMLRSRSIDDRLVKLVQAILDYGGSRSRADELFGSTDPVAITKRFFKGIQGVDNVYTQHKPLLTDILDNLIRGRLKEAAYPFISNAASDRNNRPCAVVVFVVGGVTYEEAVCVHQVNVTVPSVRVVLGGTFVHNTSSFIDQVTAATLDT